MQPWWADFLLVTWVGRVSCHFLLSTSSIARQADTPAVTQAVARLVFSCQKKLQFFCQGVCAKLIARPPDVRVAHPWLPFCLHYDTF